MPRDWQGLGFYILQADPLQLPASLQASPCRRTLEYTRPFPTPKQDNRRPSCDQEDPKLQENCVLGVLGINLQLGISKVGTEHVIVATSLSK